MGAVLLASSTQDNDTAITAATNRFGSVGCGGWGTSSTTTEGQQQAKWRGSGALSLWSVRVKSNGTTATSTFELRKNSAAANSTVSITAGSTGEFTDVSHTDTLADGDLVCWRMACGGSGTGILWVAASAVYTPDSGTVTPCVASGNVAVSAASSVTFFALQESIRVNVAEAQAKLSNQLGAGTVLSGLQVFVAANARTSATTVRTRVNGADGAQAVSIGAAATGLFEDTTNTDTLAANDDVNGSVTTGTGSGNLTLRLIHVTMTAPAGVQNFIHFFAGFTTALTAATTYFAKVAGSSAGGAASFATTDTDAQVKARLSRRVGQLRARFTGNSTTAASTVDFRVNGASPAGQPIVSVPAASTGTFTDTSDWLAVGPNDDINTRIVVGAGTSLTVSFIQLSYQFTPSLVFPSLNARNILVRR